MARVAARTVAGSVDEYEPAMSREVRLDTLPARAVDEQAVPKECNRPAPDLPYVQRPHARRDADAVDLGVHAVLLDLTLSSDTLNLCS
jgi:hypothetical protein